MESIEYAADKAVPHENAISGTFRIESVSRRIMPMADSSLVILESAQELIPCFSELRL